MNTMDGESVVAQSSSNGSELLRMTSSKNRVAQIKVGGWVGLDGGGFKILEYRDETTSISRVRTR